MIAYTIRPLHISLVKTGDIVEHCGRLRTVGKSDVKHGFFGATLWGDSYRCGTVPVRVADVFQEKPSGGGKP